MVADFVKGLTFSLVVLYTSKISTKKKTQRAPPGTVPIPDHGCKPQANSDESIGIHLEKYPGGPFNVCSAPPPSPVLALQSIVPSSLPSFPLVFFV